jgi:phosphohistidine swiveling domain-containing protein
MTLDNVARLVVDLRSVESPDREALGGKAAGLVDLIRAGFAVPPAVVLTTDVLSLFLDSIGLSDFVDPHQIRTAPVPGVVTAALDRCVELLGPGPLAVRSSARAEDLRDSSFAGQYETVLNVEGREALEEAVRRCWASCFSARVAAYGQASDEPAMAVIVQQQIDPDAAGVVFTADPVTAERSVTVVSAVRGLGDRLMSGEVTPDEWEVRGGEVAARTIVEGSLSDHQVREVAEMARRVEKHYGLPQDVEWAISGEDLYALQARPITGLPDVAPIEPHIEPPEEGFWFLDGGHYPKPMSPMAASFYLDHIGKNATAAFAEFGGLIDGIENRQVGWRVYGRVIPPLGKDGPPPPPWVLGILTRVVPPLRKKVRTARRAARTDLGGRYVERWWSEWRPRLQLELGELAMVDLQALGDADLVSRFRHLIDLAEQTQLIHFKLFIPYVLEVYGLMQFCQQELGWEPAKATGLVAGLSQWSTEPVRRLRELASQAGGSPQVAGLLRSPAPPSLDVLRSADPAFGAALDDYLATFGVRATAYEVIEPTVGEKPELLVSQLREYLDSRAEVGTSQDELAARRAALITEAEQALAAKPVAARRFAEIVGRVERSYPVREDNVFFTDNLPLGLIRLTALELGRRLAESGLLERADDVFFLEVEEAITSLQDGTDHRDLVARRKGERVWAERHVPPPSFGEEHPPPDLSRLPRDARRLMEALMWYIANDLDAPTGDGLSGVPASPGSHVGPVRVIRGEQDFTRLRPGDVLVAPITTPAWTVLFGSAGAVVTDTGGLLSHSAIIAREYGIPAVAATGSATSLLHDGQLVTVDGTRGRIEINHG